MSWYKKAQNLTNALTFENIHTDYAHGQHEYQLWAKLNGEEVGAIQYVMCRGEISIQNMLVKPEHRRQGIATALMKELKKFNQEEGNGDPVNWGVLTDEGFAFKKSLQEPKKDTSIAPLSISPRQIYTKDDVIQSREDLVPSLLRDIKKQ